ncbi:MAG: hypothetical protein NTY48_06350 [Candidatus Diapherotrites archaeon]|nr:hypothetical protein [Candidatus Diapherotrites archaeon]
MKYMKEFLEVFSLREVFSNRDAALFLKSNGASKNYVSLFLNKLVAKGKIIRLTRGIYSFSRKIDFVEKAIFPSYHGLQDALSLHGLWGQQTIPVIITPRKFRSGERTVAGGKVLVRRINRRMFFGYESIPQFDFWVTVSDLEKTLIDFAYYNEPLSEEILVEIKKRIKKEKFVRYLKQSTKNLRNKIKKRFDC